VRSLESRIESRPRQALDQQLVQEIMGEAGWMPLYWEGRLVLLLASVQAEIEANKPFVERPHLAQAVASAD
jgi:hypothetical protein